MKFLTKNKFILMHNKIFITTGNYEISRNFHGILYGNFLKFPIQNPKIFDIHGIKHTVFKIFDSTIQISSIVPEFSKSRMDLGNLDI